MASPYREQKVIIQSYYMQYTKGIKWPRHCCFKLSAVAATACGRTLQCVAGAALRVPASCRWVVCLPQREDHLCRGAQMISGAQSDVSCWALPRHRQRRHWEKRRSNAWSKYLENKGSHGVVRGQLAEGFQDLFVDLHTLSTTILWHVQWSIGDTAKFTNCPAG